MLKTLAEALIWLNKHDTQVTVCAFLFAVACLLRTLAA